jgi:NADPH:quinone reductase-like Zn-dependent oxidoreductase
MKLAVIVCTTCGSPGVLNLKEVEKPTPGDSEILIEQLAANPSQEGKEWKN